MPLLELAALAALALAAAIAYWNWNDRYFVKTYDVGFKDDAYLDVALYPKGKKGVFLFSVDDLSAQTKDEDLERLLATLETRGIKATFFTIPFLQEKFPITDSDVVRTVKKRGHEVAQHGYTHAKDKTTEPFFALFEFGTLPPEEQARHIRVGKRLLEEAGASPLGFRAPHFSVSDYTLDELVRQGFLFDSDVRVWPEGKISNKRLLGALFGSIYYPYFRETESGKILIIPTNGDYTWDLKRGMLNFDLAVLKHRFEDYYRADGVFCIVTHLHPMGLTKGRGIQFIDEFFSYVREKDVWATTMGEFAKWWSARAGLEVRTMLSSGPRGDVLEVSLKNPTKFALGGLNLRIDFQGQFSIVCGQKVLARGTGPAVVNVDVPAHR